MHQFLLTYLVAALALATCSAQVELNPYVGLITGDRRVELLQPTDGVFVYEGNRLQVGVDALFGAGQLAPLAGLSYRMSSYESEQAASFDYGRLRLPLGLAYRVLAADFDINLVLSAAVAPGLALGDERTETVLLVENKVDWRGRGTATFYLGAVTLGLQYGQTLFGSADALGQTNDFVVTLGARF